MGIEHIQKSYFEMLEGSTLIKITSTVDVGGKTAITMNEEYLNDISQKLYKSAHGTVSGMYALIEQLYDLVDTFWSLFAEPLHKELNKLEGRYIHVNQGGTPSRIRKFGLLFDGLLVSDQIVISRQEYFSSDRAPEWRPLIAQLVTVAQSYIELKDQLYLNQDRQVAIILPPMHCISKEASNALTSAIEKPTLDFFSGLCNQNITSLPELFFMGKSNAYKEVDLNPEYLNLLFARDGVSNVHGYINAVGNSVLKEQGNTWVAEESFLSTSFYDIAARFQEFERFALDAYQVGQEPEIPVYDYALYEWWFEQTSITTGAALGSSYSEDFLCKSAPLSTPMGFLDEVDLNTALEIQSESTVNELREELAIARANIRRSSEQELSTVISKSGDHVFEKLSSYEDHIDQMLRNRSNKASFVEGGKFVYSGALTFLSAVFPPLSAVSLIWGGSLADLIKLRNEEKEKVVKELKRPIASLMRAHQAASSNE